MNEKITYRIFISIIICLSILLVGTTAYGIARTRELDKVRADNDRLTERLNYAADTNRRLTETVEQCGFIVTELGDSTERNIGTVQDAIKLIKETREAVNRLEVELGNWTSDNIYSSTHGGDNNRTESELELNKLISK